MTMLSPATFSKAKDFLNKKIKELILPEVSRVSLGLHLGNKNIIMSELEFGSGGVTLLNLAYEPAGASPEENNEILKRLFARKDFLFKKVTVSLSRELAIVRIISFPRMEEKQLKTSLDFEVEKYIPNNTSEIYFDCQPLTDPGEKSASKQMKVFLAACKRDVVMNLVHQIQQAQGQIDGITLDSLASLNSFLRWLAKQSLSASGFLDIGSRVSNLTLIQNKTPVFQRDISFGGADMTQALIKNHNLSEEEAARIQLSSEAENASYQASILPVIEKIIHEVKITIHFVEGQTGQSLNLSQLHLSGGIARNPIFQSSIKSLLGYEPVIWDPLTEIKISDNVDKDLIQKIQTVLPVSLGLALE